MRVPAEMAEDIVSYPEYEEFIAKLTRFHEERGTLFRAGPILGGKRIDLYLLYKLVTERGGMDKVSEERRWRKIGEEFQLPETCTSSAYILKDVYQRYLKDYELTMLSTLPHPSAVPPRYQSLPSFPSPVSALPSIEPTTIAIETPSPAEVVRPSAPPRWTIEEIERKMKMKADEAFRRARRDLMCQPRTLLRDGRNKIRLALLSSLETDVEWALQKLTALSYVCEEDFALNDIPDLLDTLTHLIDAFLWELHDRQSYDPLYHRPSPLLPNDINPHPLPNVSIATINKENDGSHTLWRTRIDVILLQKDQSLLRRIQQVALILRNFAVMEVNRKLMARHVPTRLLMLKGALLEGTSNMEDIRIHCMDMLESLSSHYVLANNEDMLLEIIIHYLSSSDRARMQAALTIFLNIIAVQQNNEAFLGLIHIDRFWDVLYSLVILSDQDLREMANEVLYRLLQLDETLEQHILATHPLRLTFERSVEQQVTGLDVVSLNTVDHTSSPFSSTLEKQTDASLQIAQEWLQRSFEEAPNFLVQYPRMYWAYVEAIQPQSRHSQRPVLDERTFLPLLRSIFPDTALQCLIRQGRPEYFVSGIRVHQSSKIDIPSPS
jgi:hypothetical protein